MNMQMTRCPVIDGKPFLTIELAQEYALGKAVEAALGPDFTPEKSKSITDALMKNRDQITEALTMKPTSKPAARKSNGATRKPRATKATPATGTEAGA